MVSARQSLIQATAENRMGSIQYFLDNNFIYSDLPKGVFLNEQKEFFQMIDDGEGSDSSEISSYEQSVGGYIESHNAYDFMDIENDINEYINLGAEYYFEDL